MQPIVTVRDVKIGNHLPFVLIAGPCVIESQAHARECASALAEIARGLGLGFIYKSSFDKANRTSLSGARGVGLTKGLDTLAALTCPTTTDVHEPWQCGVVAAAVDLLQVPALLSRQTDLLVAAGLAGVPVNIKKGQFSAPVDVAHAAAKVGHDQVLLTERGTCFGYNTLVNDFRGLEIMKAHAPVVFDATHSVQKPGGLGDRSGGERKFVGTLARAAVAVGVAAVFIECHPDPDAAPSDGPNMLALRDMPDLLRDLVALDRLAKR